MALILVIILLYNVLSPGAVKEGLVILKLVNPTVETYYCLELLC